MDKRRTNRSWRPSTLLVLFIGLAALAAACSNSSSTAEARTADGLLVGTWGGAECGDAEACSGRPVQIGDAVFEDSISAVPQDSVGEPLAVLMDDGAAVEGVDIRTIVGRHRCEAIAVSQNTRRYALYETAAALDPEQRCSTEVVVQAVDGLSFIEGFIAFLEIDGETKTRVHTVPDERVEDGWQGSFHFIGLNKEQPVSVEVWLHGCNMAGCLDSDGEVLEQEIADGGRSNRQYGCRFEIGIDSAPRRIVRIGSSGCQTTDPTAVAATKPPAQISRISIPSSSGAFLHQEPSDSRANLCMYGGDSAPIACFKLADTDLDLSDPALGAEIDGEPWRIYDVALTGTLDTGKLTNITFESEANGGASYTCALTDNGDYPTWRLIRRAFRQWALPIYEDSTHLGKPSAAQPFDATTFHIDLEAFEAICAEAPGLTINTIAAPVATIDQPSSPVPDTIDPAAPMAIYLSERGAPAAEALMIGTLQIGERCVYVQPAGDGGRLLVLFSSVLASWDPDSRAVLGSDVTGTFSPHVDGDSVEIGGGFGQTDVLDNFTWTLPPDPSCDTTRLWIASTFS